MATNDPDHDLADRVQSVGASLGMSPTTLQLLHDETASLAAHVDVLAVGLGGSVAEGRCDEMSDLDLVVGVRSDLSIAFLAHFEKYLETSRSPIVARYMGSLRGFGFCFMLMHAKGGMVEYFVNPIDRLPVTEMSTKTIILHDPTGEADRWLAHCSALRGPAFDIDRDVRNAIADTLLELHSIRKFAVRDDFFAVRDHLHTLRKIVGSFARARQSNEPYLVYGGERDLVKALGGEFVHRLEQHPAPRASNDLRDALTSLVSLLNDQIEQCRGGVGIQVSATELIDRLARESLDLLAEVDVTRRGHH